MCGISEHPSLSSGILSVLNFCKSFTCCHKFSEFRWAPVRVILLVWAGVIGQREIEAEAPGSFSLLASFHTGMCCVYYQIRELITNPTQLLTLQAAIMACLPQYTDRCNNVAHVAGGTDQWPIVFKTPSQYATPAGPCYWDQERETREIIGTRENLLPLFWQLD